MHGRRDTSLLACYCLANVDFLEAVVPWLSAANTFARIDLACETNTAAAHVVDKATGCDSCVVVVVFTSSGMGLFVRDALPCCVPFVGRDSWIFLWVLYLYI